MTKLSGLTKGMATALGLSEASVTIAVKRLRANGLLNTGPRGPGALEMTPTDATNILLALMWNEQVTTSHLQVPALRAATFEHARVNGYAAGDRPLPAYPFLSEHGQPKTFGDVCDGIVDWITRYGNLDDGNDRIVTNFYLEVRRPGTDITLTLDDGNEDWNILYRSYDPRFWTKDHGYEGAEGRFMPVHLMRQMMSSSTSIAYESLYAIGDVLRGREFEDEETECRPPYEPSESAG